MTAQRRVDTSPLGAQICPGNCERTPQDRRDGWAGRDALGCIFSSAEQKTRGNRLGTLASIFERLGRRSEAR